jgi:hypothetical protein
MSSEEKKAHADAIKNLSIPKLEFNVKPFRCACLVVHEICKMYDAANGGVHNWQLKGGANFLQSARLFIEGFPKGLGFNGFYFLQPESGSTDPIWINKNGCVLNWCAGSNISRVKFCHN